MKEILVITSYYPPETGAASNRIHHLANGLKIKGYNVSVLTPLPNYPTGKIFEQYKGKTRDLTIENGITVHRLWIYASNSKNKLLRLLAMLSYSLSLIWFFLWKKIPDKVIVQSPPLLVAFTCMLFLKSKKRKVILNISDLWPIAGLELGAFKRNFSYRMLEKIEAFNYKKADLIMGQSEEILSHVGSVVGNKDMVLYRNYPDFEPPKKTTFAHSEGTIKIVYAGLLGVAQGIYKLCQEINYSGIEFHLYGAGAEKTLIEAYISEHPELPLFYHGELPRNELHEILLGYDLTLVPLLNRIYGSVPSKIFEYAKLGLPILYFGGGEGERLVEDFRLGWVAKPGNYEDLNRTISKISKTELHGSIRDNIRAVANREFDFGRQMDELAAQVQ